MVAPVRGMRAFGWAMVLVLFVISGVFSYTTVELYSQRRSPAQQQKLKVVGRQPLPVEAWKWTVSPRAAMELTACVAAGAAGLGILGAAVMVVTSPLLASTLGHGCVDCGRPIQPGTLCQTCETS